MSELSIFCSSEICGANGNHPRSQLTPSHMTIIAAIIAKANHHLSLDDFILFIVSLDDVCVGGIDQFVEKVT